MPAQLSLSARPRTFDTMVGEGTQKIVAAIRGHMKSGRVVKAWLFHGPKGTGKTTISRILALAYQCGHGDFGNPCKDCRKAQASFPIHEINASDITGIDRLRQSLEGADYGVMGAGRYRVYILDECQKLSDSAQSLLLKYLEENTPDTTVFILCSTEPHKILETLRSRCATYEMRDLGQDDVLKLVNRLLRLTKSELPADRLADALAERQVGSPRLVAQAVEKYLAGLEPDEAAQVEGSVTIDTKALTRAVVKGDWPAVSQALLQADSLNVRAVRLSVIAYLKTVLLESPEISQRGDVVAKSLSSLCLLQNAEDMVISANLAAELYRCTALFSKWKL
jgi:DNA polymerase III subunit gamma/tau